MKHRTFEDNTPAFFRKWQERYPRTFSYNAKSDQGRDIMFRTFHYTITDEQAGQTIGEFLRSCGYSRHILTHLKQTQNGILLDGRPALTNHRLREGEHLSIRLEEAAPSAHIPPVSMELSIVYEDDDILVVNKPADTPIHPSFGNRENTLANGIAWYYQQQGIPFVYRCINRLDRDTSGLLIIAKHVLSAAILTDDMKHRRIHRTYLAIVEGNLKHPGTVEAPIGRKEGSILERCVDFERGECAVTHYTPVSYHEKLNLTLLSLRLATGRTHQIRVHMNYLGHPVIGDYLYYPRRDFIKRQALHSWKLEFLHPITKERLTFEAPLPDDMLFIIQ